MKAFLVVLALGSSLAVPAAADPVHKPSAPVQLRLDSRPIAGGYEVTLVATPTRAVPTLQLTLAGKTIAFAATSAGQARTLTTTIAVAPGAGLDVVGGASLAGRSTARVVRLGVAQQPAPKRAVTRTLPDGRRVREVR